jgi:hypothetical protein
MYFKGGVHPRDENAAMDSRKEMEEEAIFGHSEIEFNSNDNELGISRGNINFDDDDEDDDDK